MENRQINDRINVIDDEFLYPEANAFIKRMEEKGIPALSKFQWSGLREMTLGKPFPLMLQFLHHQQKENEKRRPHITTFYKELEKVL